MFLYYTLELKEKKKVYAFSFFFFFQQCKYLQSHVIVHSKKKLSAMHDCFLFSFFFLSLLCEIFFTYHQQEWRITAAWVEGLIRTQLDCLTQLSKFALVCFLIAREQEKGWQGLRYNSVNQLLYYLNWIHPDWPIW